VWVKDTQRAIGWRQLVMSIFGKSHGRSIDAGGAQSYIHCNMQDKYFDELLSDYRRAVDNWVTALKAEEALANDDHSMVEMEKWDAAGFSSHDAEGVAKKARDRYKNALRKKNYGF
jgi:hypothetical protein